MSDSPSRRIGILGGSFDPPHLGHIHLARHVAKEISLDLVICIPAGDPWQKEVAASATDRLAMTELAITDDALLAVSDLEVLRSGPTYTVDTLRALHSMYPHDELYFILGADALATVPTWHESERLGDLAHFIAVNRGTAEGQTPLELAGRLDWVCVPAIDISSTMCRDAVRSGQSLDGLVPPAVAEYISAHGLYRSSST